MKLFSNKIASLKNAERGRRVFILGNGPSITKEDLSVLDGECTIGMNASTLLEERFGFQTSYYVVSDKRFITHPEKRDLACSKLHDKTVRVLRADLQEYDDSQYASRTFYIPPLQRDGFSSDLRAGFFFGCTTTMLAIQLAAYLGCTEIYLLGVDLRYSVEQPRFYAESDPQLEDAFTSVQIFNIASAKNHLATAGKKLFNCSMNSFLTPYVETVPFSGLFLPQVPRSAEMSVDAVEPVAVL